MKSLYDQLARYTFAHRYAAGRTVADITREGSSHGRYLISAAADSLETPPPDSLRDESRYDLILAFDAFEGADDPAAVLHRVRAGLGPGGVAILSTPLRQRYPGEPGTGYSNPGGGMFASRFRTLLEQEFEYVDLYRQGSVAGAVIFRDGEPPSGRAEISLQTAPFYADAPTPGDTPLSPGFLLAVCSAAELPDATGGAPYLLLDSEHRVFDRSDELAEDSRLLEEEIRHMQRTEVQVFREFLLFAASKTVVRELLRRLEALAASAIRKVRNRRPDRPHDG